MQYRSPPRPPPAHSMAVSATRRAYACRRWTGGAAGADLKVGRVGWPFGCLRCAAVDEVRVPGGGRPIADPRPPARGQPESQSSTAELGIAPGPAPRRGSAPPLPVTGDPMEYLMMAMASKMLSGTTSRRDDSSQSEGEDREGTKVDRQLRGVERIRKRIRNGAADACERCDQRGVPLS